MKQYQDRDWLYRKYWDEELSIYQISTLYNGSRATIYRWLKKLKIPIKPTDHPASCRNKSKSKLGEKNPWFGKRGEETPRWGKVCHKETRDKISKANKGKIPWSKGKKCPQISKGRMGITPWNKGKQCPRLGQKGQQNYFYGKHFNREKNPRWNSKIKICKVCGKSFYIKKSQYKKRLYCSKNCYRKDFNNWIKAISNKRPTNPEKVFNEMTPDIIRYTGNGAWWRKLDDGKHKNPDFKVTGQNKVIEVFGDYWHRGEDPQELIDLYKQAGLDCLIFWEHEVYNNQEEILEQVNQFIEQ